MSISRRPVLLIVAACILACASPALAGGISGYIYTPIGAPFTEMTIGVTQTGNLAGSGLGWSWAASPVGWYDINNLPAGTYSVGFSEKDEWNRALQWNVGVGSGTTGLDRKIDYPNYGTGKFYDGVQVPWWAQSFVATGSSIISASIDCAIEFGPDTTVTIHENDPWGTQIGPSRTVPTNIANPSAVFWSAGDVPTVPGRIYCAKFSAAGAGLMPFFSFVKVKNSDIYQEGKTWRNGYITNLPLKTVIGQDDDGIITTVSTRKVKPGFYMSGNVIGQTFVAKGSSLLYVNVLAGSTYSLRVSLHDGVGTGGQGGPQVGLAKNITVDPWNHRCLAVWAPNEAGPLQAGKTYYVKFTRSDGGSFVLYHSNTNEYSGGTAYVNGGAQPADLSITIAEEAYSGSASVPRMGIRDIAVTRYSDSATITWTSDPAASENYVEFGAGTPYTGKKYDYNATSHSVTLTGLVPNTLYHARVVSKASGYRDGVSRDFVFVTEPLTANLLTNPGFETASMSGWTKIGSGDIAVRNYPWTPTGQPSHFGTQAHGGNCFQGGVTNGGQLLGGCYQRVAVAPGRPLSARAWIWTWQQDQIGGMKPYTVCGRIGIDPTGGTNPDSGNVVWSPFVAAQDLFGNRDGSWTEVWTTAVPTGGYATVFIRSGADQAIAWTVFGHDDAVLTQEPALTTVQKLSQLSAMPDGAKVSFSDKIVVATEAQAGAVYLEESDRTSGIRVESVDTFDLGRRVSVTGYLGTKVNGERYILGAVKTSDVAGQEIKSMATRLSSIGLVSPSNMGMLMTVAGRVTATGANYFLINDGSLPGNGLRVQANSLTARPTVNQFVSVTGVVQMRGSSAATAKVIIRPRFEQDCRVVQ